MPVHNNNNNQGFALLMAIVVVGVVISISLSVLDLTIKQLRLSTNSKDSEVAFSAANAGLECARYWRIANSAKFEVGDQTFTPTSCFGVAAPTYTYSNPAAGSFLYKDLIGITWGSSGSERCTKISMLILVSDISSNYSLTGMKTILPGYPYGDTKTCEAGGRCTVISIQGFNKACSVIGTEGTVQREVLLEL